MPASRRETSSISHCRRRARVVRGFLICLVLAAEASIAQVRSGPQVVTFFSLIDDTDQPYALYVPKNFDAQKKYPLVMSLHGAGSNHRLNLKRVFGKGNKPGETDAEATRYFPEFRDVDYLVVSPLARGTMGYQGIAETDVYAVLEDVKKRFLVDKDRIYLTGLSMGGGGTLWLGLTRPDLWAAIAPVCPAPPVGIEDLGGNALNYPVKIFQGDADPLVRPERTREWVKRFKDSGVQTEYVEYPGVKHNSWENAYANGAIFDWFADKRRNANPERVRFAARSFQHTSAYWVRLDSFTAGSLAQIDARRTGASMIEVTTTNLEGFTLTLDPKKPWTVVVDGKKVATQGLSFRKENGTWVNGAATPPAKRVSSMLEAIGQRHIYVYGTADNPAPEELTRRREEAQRLAEWGSPRMPLLLTLRAMADKEVKDSDLATRANLVLLGNAMTNSWIAKYALTLPLALRPDAADYSLAFVAPLGDRHALILSGKPVSLSPRPFTANPLTNDYLVLRGNEILASGHFTRDWKLTTTLPDVVEVRP